MFHSTINYLTKHVSLYRTEKHLSLKYVVYGDIISIRLRTTIQTTKCRCNLFPLVYRRKQNTEEEIIGSDRKVLDIKSEVRLAKEK